MDRDHARANVVAGTVGMVVVGVLLAAFYYGVVTRADPVRCLFGDAQCSQTVATYLLALLAAAAFYVTFRAVLYTKSTAESTNVALQQSQKATEYAHLSFENSLEVFRTERTPVMTLQRCTNIDDATVYANPGYMAERDRKHGHLDADVLEYFLDDEEMTELATAPPPDCIMPPDCVTPAERRAAYPYDPYNFDVLSLGRVPFINAYLYLNIKGRKLKPLRVYAGSVAPADYVHIVLWVSKEMGGGAKIRWSKEASDDSPVPLMYWPPPDEVIEKTFDYDEIAAKTFDYDTPDLESENGPDDAAAGAPPP